VKWPPIRAKRGKADWPPRESAPPRSRGRQATGVSEKTGGTAKRPRIPLDRRFAISLRSACPENRFPLFGADLEAELAGRKASHQSVILCRCSAKQPARKPLPPFRAHCSYGSNSFTRLRFDSAHASSRPSGPFAAPLGRPDRPARSRACLTSGSERRASSEPPRLLPDTKQTGCAVRDSFRGDGAGWPGGSVLRVATPSASALLR
jgi:hypothetical protein